MFEKGSSIEVAVRFIASTPKTLLTTDSLLSFTIILNYHCLVQNYNYSIQSINEMNIFKYPISGDHKDLPLAFFTC
jgi:hypothetical protein